MAQQYLDKTGLSYFWGKIKDKISSMLTASSGKLIPYGYCTTAAATVAKTVTVTPAITELVTGQQIIVKFQYANTGTNPTLKVGSTTAKAIKRYGTTAAGASAASNWNANSVVMLTYDGTYWMLTDFNNTTYSALSQADATAGTATTGRLINAKVLHDSIVELLPTKVSDLNNDSGFITTETDPTVPSWAKESTKPSYATSELTNDSDFVSDASYVHTDNNFTTTYKVKLDDIGTVTASEITTIIDTIS